MMVRTGIAHSAFAAAGMMCGHQLAMPITAVPFPSRYRTHNLMQMVCVHPLLAALDAVASEPTGICTCNLQAHPLPNALHIT